VIYVDLDAASRAVICATFLTLVVAIVIEELTPLARRYAFEIAVSLGGLVCWLWLLFWLWRLR
jgi:hypothetical protein